MYLQIKRPEGRLRHKIVFIANDDCWNFIQLGAISQDEERERKDIDQGVSIS